MSTITCVFHFGNGQERKVDVDYFNVSNAANSIESAIIKTYKAMNPEIPGMILVKSFKCKDINNGSDLQPYRNRTINENELKSDKEYHFDVNAIFTKADLGGRRRTRKSRRSRKSRKSRR